MYGLVLEATSFGSPPGHTPSVAAEGMLLLVQVKAGVPQHFLKKARATAFVFAGF